MINIGYKLCSEEHGPADLVKFAQRAEQVGFAFAMISDHYHPWTHSQGQSPFVWSVLGAIALTTKKLRVGTGVTCPTIRIHPAIIAQASATVAAMMPGRFVLGLGAGENLNEHITGEKWPPADVRLKMLEEAIRIIRLLWSGDQHSYYGDYYTVENAELFTLPKKTPLIAVAGGGEKSAILAGQVADGFIGTAPKEKLLKAFSDSGGKGKPCFGEVSVCWAKNESDGRRTALECWPNVAITGELTQELRTPAHFEQATEMLTEDKVAEEVVCGDNPEKHIAAIKKYAEAGYDNVWVHQIGPDQEGFFDFYETEILPKLASAKVVKARN